MTTTRAAIKSSVKHRTFPTTTLDIQRPENFVQLEQHFYVERYVLPDELRYSQNGAITYARVHTALRNQLDYAYKAFRHDRLDSKEHWAVYALIPQGDRPPTVTLDWLRNSGELPHGPVSFGDVPFHITLKLLQIAMIRGVTSTRFVGQDNCYTYAGPDKADDHICVQVELKGSPENRESDAIQEFRVVSHARRFGPSDAGRRRPWDAVYGKRAVGNRFYFLHLKTDQIPAEETVYHEVRFANRRAQAMYHDIHDLDAGRGKILADFIREYLGFLRGLGIEGTSRYREFAPFRTRDDTNFDFARLGPVGVYDNRLARDAHPLASYIALFAQLRPDVTFVPVEQVTDAPAGGILALLDARGSDFSEDGVLAGMQDPYPLLYRTTPNIPKQSLIVNFNNPNLLAGGHYLDYRFPSDDDIKLHLAVALDDLYLKCAVIRGRAPIRLPLISSERAYVRKHTYHGESYATALCYSDERLQFFDLSDPMARRDFSAACARWGVDYAEQFEAFLGLQKHDQEPSDYRFIVGPDLFVVIEDLEESVLYDYDKIAQRQRERTEQHHISEFKLGSQYKSLRKGVTIEQLNEFDQLLDEIEMMHSSLSLEDLLGEPWISEIARIFGGQNADKKVQRRALMAKYRKLGRFLSLRGSDVQLSQGIWYDETGAFVVGAKNPMNLDGQERANLIRRFRVLQGKSHFKQEPLLAEMAVQFVRPRQYTVFPYPFHLIDLYVENVRRYGGDI